MNISPLKIRTIRTIRATAIKVPMTYVLGTSAQAIREAPLLLIDLESEEGVTGHAYNSCGLGLMAPQAVADEAEKLLAGGFRAVKLRLGYATLEEDLAATRAVRNRVVDAVAIMTDFNQALTAEEALRVGCARQVSRATRAWKCRRICIPR